MAKSIRQSVEDGARLLDEKRLIQKREQEYRQDTFEVYPERVFPTADNN